MLRYLWTTKALLGSLRVSQLSPHSNAFLAVALDIVALFSPISSMFIIVAAIPFSGQILELDQVGAVVERARGAASEGQLRRAEEPPGGFGGGELR